MLALAQGRNATAVKLIGIANAARPGMLPAAESGFRLIAQGDEALADRIALADHAERTLDLQYYIIAKIAADLRRRGVRLVILTNSLAATDAPAVHIGYSRYRAELLRQGTELYELRPQVKPLEGAPATRFGSFGQSRSSLHAKVIVVDQKVSVIGSLNLDPRSRFENMEMALFVDSAPLAAQVLDLFQDPARENAYRLRLAPDGHSIEWVLGVGKTEQVFATNPKQASDASWS